MCIHNTYECSTFLERLSSCKAAKTRFGSATLVVFSGPLGVEFMDALDLKGENGSAGATLTFTIGLREVFKLGDRTCVGVLVDNRGNDRLSRRTLGKEPNPWYFGLNAAAAAGG